MHRPCSIAVGGGLAGAAFALELARHGERVLVLERSRQPGPMVCGEFLSGEAQDLLAYLGLDLNAMGATGVSRLRLAAGSRFAEAPLPFRGAGLSRQRLDEALLLAAARAGAEVLRGVTVNGIDVSGQRVVVSAGTQRYMADAVAIATGKHALRQFPRPPSDMVGFKLQLRLTPSARRVLDGVVQLVAFEDGYLGACIVEDGLAPVCWVMRRRLLKRVGPGWAAQSAYLAAQSELLAELLHGSAPVWERPAAVAQIPYGFLRRQSISPVIFPIGDQLAVIPSMTGDGMAIALSTGIRAAQAVLRGMAADAFQRRMISSLRGQFRLAGAVQLIFATTALHGVGLSVARALPGLVTTIVRSTRLAATALPP